MRITACQKEAQALSCPGNPAHRRSWFDRLEQHDAANACLFHKVIDGHYCKGSTIITTNIDFKQLGDYLGDPVITTATVDRMIHHSIIISIQGPSWRLHESRRLNSAQ
ncbi:MAG: ATP-binding protein [Chlorobium sp.]|nr:ATP-binding protein [Chlorobium sp.]